MLSEIFSISKTYRFVCRAPDLQHVHCLNDVCSQNTLQLLYTRHQKKSVISGRSEMIDKWSQFSNCDMTVYLGKDKVC